MEGSPPAPAQPGRQTTGWALLPRGPTRTSHLIPCLRGWGGEVALSRRGLGVCPGWVGGSGTSMETPERPGGAHVPRHHVVPPSPPAAREHSEDCEPLAQGAVTDLGRGAVLGQQLFTPLIGEPQGPPSRPHRPTQVPQTGTKLPGVRGASGSPLALSDTSETVCLTTHK